MFRTTAPPPMQQTQVVQPPPQYGPYNPYGQYPSPPPQKQGISVPPGYHSPSMAIIWGLLCFICAGQFYNRQFVKGVAMVVAFLIIGFFTGFLAWFIMWPMALVDAYKIAEKLNRGDVVGEWECF